MPAPAGAYPARVLVVLLVAALAVSLVSSLVPDTIQGRAAVHMNSVAPRAQNVTSWISDGTFDAIPGPWAYTNGTTGAVTASRDPTARARLGHTTPHLQFDSMDNVFGPTPWTSVTPGKGQALSNLSQEHTIHTEGNGSLRDDVTILQNNQWGGALRDDALPWNWSRYDRIAIWMDKATPSTLWTWVSIQDTSGRSSYGFYNLVSGWYRYAFDLNAPLDPTQVDFVEIAFTGSAGTTGTVYVDDIELFNSTTFAETASVAQTFSKPAPTGGAPASLRLVFDLQATASLNVVSYLAVGINGTVEWSEIPVSAGIRTVAVDVSGDMALRGTGSFRLVFSLRLNRTGWEEASMTAWIDNVTLVTPGTLARIVVTPASAFVPVNETRVFNAEGRDATNNPVPLAAINWSATIGQIIGVNGTTATFKAPSHPATGVVSAAVGNVTGTSNVTVDWLATPPSSPAFPWGALLWPGLALIAALGGGAGFVALRRSAKNRFWIEDLFVVAREGLLIGHATRRRDAHGDEDILAGMLTAIMSFAKDSFQEEREGLKRFEIGQRKVALEVSEHVYVAAIGQGPILDRLSESMREFLGDIEERYGKQLQSWSGMSQDLTGIDTMMESFAWRGRYGRGDWRRLRVQASPAPRAEPAQVQSGVSNAPVSEEPLRPA